MRNFPEEAVAPFLLIEAPRLLFPFARQIVCESIQNMGFPPLLLEPIDFAAAYVAQLQAAQQQQQDEGGEQQEQQAGTGEQPDTKPEQNG
jgi:preprotein translocase subunit SecB